MSVISILLSSFMSAAIVSYSFKLTLSNILLAILTTSEISNLPDGLTSQIIEQSLMFNNFLCFYNSNEFGLVLCRYKFGGEYDLYWKPKTVDLLTISGGVK